MEKMVMLDPKEKVALSGLKDLQDLLEVMD
jgi:hypothetical protein